MRLRSSSVCVSDRLRATIANISKKLPSASLETGTESSNSLRSANEVPVCGFSVGMNEIARPAALFASGAAPASGLFVKIPLVACIYASGEGDIWLHGRMCSYDDELFR